LAGGTSMLRRPALPLSRRPAGVVIASRGGRAGTMVGYAGASAQRASPIAPACCGLRALTNPKLRRSHRCSPQHGGRFARRDARQPVPAPAARCASPRTPACGAWP
jgi:hypothetical protein